MATKKKKSTTFRVDKRMKFAETVVKDDQEWCKQAGGFTSEEDAQAWITEKLKFDRGNNADGYKVVGE